MSTNLALASITATGGSQTATRTLGTRWGDILNVKDYGAVGNGIADDTAEIQACFDAAFGTAASPHGQNAELNKAVFFPAGNYLVSGNPALTVTAVRGGLIFGSGMVATRIFSTTAGSVLFKLNGFGFSSIQDMAFENLGSGSLITLDFNWDNSVAQGSQNSSFINCYFAQNNSDAGSVVVALGRDGFQADTSSFINCWVTGANAGSGYKAYNQNVLAITLVGGQITGCAKGVYVPAGTISGIFNTYFSNRISSTDYDIIIEGGEGNYSIQGCRSESYNFYRCSTDTISANITGCNLNGELLGHFVNAGVVNITNCWSKLGDVVIGGGGSALGQISIDNSFFNRWDALTISANNATAEIKNTVFGNNSFGLNKTVLRKRVTLSATRTFDVEAANVSTDKNFLYENYLNPRAQNGIINTVPTTLGASPTFTNASPTVVTFPDIHWFQGGEPVAFTIVSSGVLPTGIISGRTYFVTDDSLTNSPGTQTTCHLSLNSSNAAAGTADVNVSSSATGMIDSWSVRRWAIGDQVLNTAVSSGTSPGWVCTTAGYAATVNAPEVQAVFGTMPVLT